MRRIIMAILLCLTAIGAAASAAEVLQDCATVQEAQILNAIELESSESQFPYFSIKTPKDWSEFLRGYFLRQASEADQTGVWLHASPDHPALEIAEDLENIFDAAYLDGQDCAVAAPSTRWRVRFAKSDERTLAIAHANVKDVGYAVLLSGNKEAALSDLTTEILLPILSSFKPLTPRPANAEVVTIYIARHAEKNKSVEGTPLTIEGEERAKLLSKMLKASGITAVYATQALRTQQTAAPLAAHLNLAVEIADVTQLSEFANDVLAEHEGEKVLIVSHSHTIPALLESLGVSDPPFILESEYDNLYVVHASQNGEAFFSRIKYGLR